MTDLLLDTHIALWLDSGDESLGTSRKTIEAAWHTGSRLFLSAVSVWEIALLVDRGFIELDLPERPGSSGSCQLQVLRRCRSTTKPQRSPVISGIWIIPIRRIAS